MRFGRFVIAFGDTRRHLDAFDTSRVIYLTKHSTTPAGKTANLMAVLGPGLSSITNVELREHSLTFLQACLYRALRGSR